VSFDIGSAAKGIAVASAAHASWFEVMVTMQPGGCMRVAGYIAGVMIVVLSMVTQATAGNVVAVPEIDAGSIVGGLGLLAGGILVARARWGAK
jgi:hypothetical protein